MESKYNYFKRDISWLSFNYRVLLEALDERLPLYERINFISIYSSNLEEFYKIRVADHKAVASGATESDEETVQSARELVEEINHEVNRQLDDRVRIYEEKILPALRKNHIIFYQDRHVEPFHQQFIKDFFREEIFPYLQPVPVSKDKIVSFLRDNRLYLAIRLYPKENRNPANRQPFYFVMKQPYAKVPRFIELPRVGEYFYLMYMEDIIKANIDRMFPGYELDCSYCCKISRDADIFVDDAESSEKMVEQLKKKVKKRKIGAVCRFVYDRKMPVDYLEFLVDAFDINRDELVPGDKHLNLEDLSHLPNPNRGNEAPVKPVPMKLNYLDEKELRAMGQLVSGYLDFAERQAEREQPMTMSDWANYLDRILTMSGEQLLQDSGKVSHTEAMEHATNEYRKYKQRTISDVEQDYLDSIRMLDNLKKKKSQNETEI